MGIWRRVFDIHADVDNLNPIVCGCGLGYDVSDIRWMDYPIIECG
jgi:hypothetical protein